MFGLGGRPNDDMLNRIEALEGVHHMIAPRIRALEHRWSQFDARLDAIEAQIRLPTIPDVISPPQASAPPGARSADSSVDPGPSETSQPPADDSADPAQGLRDMVAELPEPTVSTATIAPQTPRAQ